MNAQYNNYLRITVKVAISTRYKTACTHITGNFLLVNVRVIPLVVNVKVLPVVVNVKAIPVVVNVKVISVVVNIKKC